MFLQAIGNAGESGTKGEEDDLYINDGKGGFTANSGLETSTALVARAMAFADVDGDGDADLVIGRREKCPPGESCVQHSEYNALQLVGPRGFMSYTQLEVPPAGYSSNGGAATITSESGFVSSTSAMAAADCDVYGVDCHAKTYAVAAADVDGDGDVDLVRVPAVMI